MTAEEEAAIDWSLCTWEGARRDVPSWRSASGKLATVEENGATSPGILNNNAAKKAFRTHQS